MDKIYRILKNKFEEVTMNRRLSMIRFYSEKREDEIKKFLLSKNIKGELNINCRTLNGVYYLLSI